MYLQSTLELVLELNADKFNKLLSRAFDRGELQSSDDEKTFVDTSLLEEGLTVVYHDKKYKKKVRLTVSPNVILGGDEPDQDNIPALVRKMEKRVVEHFGSKYTLDDFNLNRIYFITDINVHSRENATAYIKALQRVGKIKGFSPPGESRINTDISFCLDGNSNGIEFMIYSLETLLREQQGQRDDSDRKRLKEIIRKSEGLLRAEVRLMESQAIRACTGKYNSSLQISDLLGKAQSIFLDTFQRAIPFGDFQKKDRAVEIIRNKVADATIRRRMLRLVELIPEKKSLLLAQKALNYRRVDDVMDAFGAIDLSPVTLSKRSEMKKLDNLYKHL